MLRRLASASEELAEREAAASYEAKHDALSGLPNRQFFALRTDQALKETRRAGNPFRSSSAISTSTGSRTSTTPSGITLATS